MTLVYISAASLIGGLLSVGLAALVSFATRAHWVSSLISFAIGALDIRTDGRALDRGALGERVRVMNLASRTVVTGAVSGPGAVAVAR